MWERESVDYRLTAQNSILCTLTASHFIASTCSLCRFFVAVGVYPIQWIDLKSKSAAFSILPSITVSMLFLSFLFFYWKSFMGRRSDGLLFLDDFLFIANNLRPFFLSVMWYICVCLRKCQTNERTNRHFASIQSSQAATLFEMRWNFVWVNMHSERERVRERVNEREGLALMQKVQVLWYLVARFSFHPLTG